MDKFLQTTLNDPFVGKIAAAVFGIFVINLLVRFFQGLISSRVGSGICGMVFDVV